MTARSWLAVLSTTAVLTSGLALATLPASARPGPPPAPPGLEAKAAAAAAELQRDDPRAAFTVSPSTRAADFVRPRELERRSGSPRQVAASFLAERGALVGASGSQGELRFEGSTQDTHGGVVLAFSQRYRGLPVLGAELRVRVEDGAVTSVHGSFVPDIRVSTTPGLARGKAEDTAVRGVRRHGGDVPGLAARRTGLVVFRTGLLAGEAGSNRLAYEVEVGDPAGSARQTVYVDATTGAVLLAVDGIHRALDRHVYEGSTSNEVWKEGEADPIPVTPENADKVQMWQNLADGARETYNVFSSLAGRDSYNGAGIAMRSVARASQIAQICPNATWNGATVNFCTGMDTDDIVGHEWGHAYTQHTSNLIYAWQSGALNESYSDVWGEVVDLLNGRGDDDHDQKRADGTCATGPTAPADAGDRWLNGEDRSAGPTRDLWHPVCLGMPGKVTDAQYIVPADGWDNGGVHINSGVPNHAFALLVDGGTYNEHVVRGIGLDKAAAIWWDAGLLLTSSSRFPTFATALETACADLTGHDVRAVSTTDPVGAASGQVVTSKDCAQLSYAINAVELRTNVVDPTNPGPTTPYLDTSVHERCPDGTATTTASSDFEDGLGEWTVGHFGSHHNDYHQPDWVVKGDLPTGARDGSTKAAFGGFIGSSFQNDGVYYLESPDITLPATDDSRVSFDHWFRILLNQGVRRGGNLKLSVDGGDFALVPASAFVANPYNTQLAPGFYPKDMVTQPVFSSTDANAARSAWARSMVDLGGLTEPGDVIRLRFDLGHDYNHFGNHTGAGWYVDNVAVYSCSDDHAPVANPWHFDRANAAGWNDEPVTIRWRWSDAGTGIDLASCTVQTVVATEGVQTPSAACSDLAGNTAEASYQVSLDLTDPTLTGPAVTPERQLQGLSITGTFSASDALSGLESTSCEATFDVDSSVVGTHQLTCSGTDRAGNTASGTASYDVISASTAIDELVQQVVDADLAKGTTRALVSLLENARKNRDRGKDADAVSQLESFIAQVQAQSGKAIPAATADAFVAAAEQVIASIEASPSP